MASMSARAASRAVSMFQHPRRYRKLRRAPSTVAAGSTKADDLFFDHRNPKSRVAAQKIIGGPKACVATSQDGDVHFGGARESGAWSELLSSRFKPEAISSVVSHAGNKEST